MHYLNLQDGRLGFCMKGTLFPIVTVLLQGLHLILYMLQHSLNLCPLLCIGLDLPQPQWSDTYSAWKGWHSFELKTSDRSYSILDLNAENIRKAKCRQAKHSTFGADKHKKKLGPKKYCKFMNKTWSVVFHESARFHLCNYLVNGLLLLSIIHLSLLQQHPVPFDLALMLQKHLSYNISEAHWLHLLTILSITCNPLNATLQIFLSYGSWFFLPWNTK